MPTLRRIFKQGHSAVIVIPRWMLEMQGLEVGSVAKIECYPAQFITIERHAGEKPVDEAEEKKAVEPVQQEAKTG